MWCSCRQFNCVSFCLHWHALLILLINRSHVSFYLIDWLDKHAGRVADTLPHVSDCNQQTLSNTNTFERKLEISPSEPPSQLLRDLPALSINNTARQFAKSAGLDKKDENGEVRFLEPHKLNHSWVLKYADTCKVSIRAGHHFHSMPH